MYKICEWDAATGRMVERNCTPLERAEIDSRRNAPPPVPQVVTRRQARQALMLANLLDQVDPLIAAISDPTDRSLAQIWWADALDFDRNHPLVIQIGAGLGLDSSDLDALFIQAAGL